MCHYLSTLSIVVFLTVTQTITIIFIVIAYLDEIDKLASGSEDGGGGSGYVRSHSLKEGKSVLYNYFLTVILSLILTVILSVILTVIYP